MLRHGSDSGVEGLPMSLAVTMVVLAITVPLIFGGFRAYDRARVETALESEIREALTTIQMLYSSGPGNSAKLDFTAESGALSAVDTVSFGDAPGSPLSTTARYSLAGRPEVLIPSAQPPVHMMSANATAFSIGAGHHEIVAQCMATENDLNGDGLTPDAYVCLSLAP